jgi:hypothetical protein
VAPIVSAADLPYSLTVRLPRIMRPMHYGCVRRVGNGVVRS